MELDYLNDPEFQELIRQYIQYLADNLIEIKEDLDQDERIPFLDKIAKQSGSTQ